MNKTDAVITNERLTNLAPRSQRPQVVILGAGFAGLNAARKLGNSAVDVVLIDRNNYHLFQPLLYQVATAGLDPSDISQPVRGIVGKYDNVHVIMSEVQAIDRQNKTITLERQVVPYDYLIVATGAQVKYFGPAAWQENSTPLKTVPDTLALRRRILTAFEIAEQSTDRQTVRDWLTFVIIGAGPTGVEMAGAIREIAAEVMKRDFRTIQSSDAQVILIDAQPYILASYPHHLSEKAADELRKRDVEVLLDARVSDIDDLSVTVGNRVIGTHTVIWAAGVEASPLLKSLDTPLDWMGRAIVDADLSLPGSDCEFVLGDAAHFAHQRDEPLPGLAPVAIQQGRYIARRIKRNVAGKPTDDFHYFDKGQMSTIGRAAAVVDFGRINTVGFFAWVLWLTVHLLYLIGFKNRIIVMIEWTYSYLAFKRGSRIIVEAPNTHNDALPPGELDTPALA